VLALACVADSTETEVVTLRMPRELRDWLARNAGGRRVSVSAYAVNLLQQVKNQGLANQPRETRSTQVPQVDLDDTF